MEAEQSSKEKKLQGLQNCLEKGKIFNTLALEVNSIQNVLLLWITGVKMTKKLLLDVDCGVDDAQAIMLALGDPNIQILGITCVHGNTTVENVCKNVLRVLQACRKLEVGPEIL